MNGGYMTIAEVSKKFGMSIDTLRYYERQRTVVFNVLNGWRMGLEIRSGLRLPSYSTWEI
jgi:hypothetical protein